MIRLTLSAVPPRPLRDLIDLAEPGWRMVDAWLNEGKNQAVVLPTTRAHGEECLVWLQVTSRSPMGAIALESAGLVVDHGWIRVLGAGGEAIAGSLTTWNELGASTSAHHQLHDALVIGHDVIGGFFALNGGAWPHEIGRVFYFGPDTLAWDSLGMTYSGWLQWLFDGDLEKFYGPNRWSTWIEDVAALSLDQGFSIYPSLWAQEGGPIANRTRSPVPMTELWSAQLDMAHQLDSLPEGSQVRVEVEDGE